MKSNNRPLEGVKVVELANFIAAPSCARYLADLGADVIKVEAPSRDPLRGTAINEGRPLGDCENTSFDLDNANKRDICLNTKSPEGLEALLKLIVTAMDRADLVGDLWFFPQANLQNNLEEFYNILVEAAAQKDLTEWCERFKAADIPYAVAQTWDELLKDEGQMLK